MLKGIRVVAADDDELSLHLLTTILRSLGVHCTPVMDGKGALEALEANPDTDILLLDIQMPVIDGFEVLWQCKSNPYLTDIPVIVMSIDRHEKLKCLKLGASDFLAKPYDVEELELAITKWVQWRRLALSAKRAKNEFLALASHELRTPMHQIAGLADLLSMENLGADHREIVDLLKQATGNMTSIVTDILKYAQLDQDTTGAPIEQFSLRTTVNDVIRAIAKSAEIRGIKVVLDIDDGVSDLLCGPSSYVHKVFTVTVENAVKFSSGGEIRIAIKEEMLGGQISRFFCSVSDQGIGIPEEFHQEIFKPFARVDPSNTRKYSGVGLGLAIAKRKLDLMGGGISVKSKEAMGSLFDFTFHCDLKQLTVADHSDFRLFPNDQEKGFA